MFRSLKGHYSLRIMFMNTSGTGLQTKMELFKLFIHIYTL